MTRRLIASLILTLAAMVVAGAGCGPAQPASPALPVLTAEQAVLLGRAAVAVFEKEVGPPVADLAVQSYVRTIGERLARSTQDPSLPYQFIVLDSSAVNAYALPAGPVLVTRGLIARLETEGQLAAALAHQLAHVNAGHVNRELIDRLGLPLLREAVAAIQAKEAGQPVLPRAAEALARTLGALGVLQFSPAAESEADRLGLDTLVAAGYNPGQAVAFLQHMTPARGPATEFSRTHPSAAGRDEALADLAAGKYPDTGGRVARGEYRREVLERLTTGPR